MISVSRPRCTLATTEENYPRGAGTNKRARCRIVGQPAVSCSKDSNVLASLDASPSNSVCSGMRGSRWMYLIVLGTATAVFASVVLLRGKTEADRPPLGPRRSAANDTLERACALKKRRQPVLGYSLPGRVMTRHSETVR